MQLFTEWVVAKSGWTVGVGAEQRPIEARDICFLFRRFTSFGEDVTRPYVRALEARRVPHVLTGGKSFHEREEVIAMRAALTAIEWPDDELHVYAALRGPFFSLQDEALGRFRSRFGNLHPLGALQHPEEAATLDDALQAVHESLRDSRPVAYFSQSPTGARCDS